MSASRNVLVVEDEPLIAMMLEDFLEELGHRTVATCDGVDEALAALGAGGVDAAILDVNLRGGEQSFAVADALAAAGVPFVFASGGTGDAVPTAHADRPTLSKPFTIEGLEAALDRL